MSTKTKWTMAMNGFVAVMIILILATEDMHWDSFFVGVGLAIINAACCILIGTGKIKL